MFTHKTEGNTLYIYRTKRDVYYRNSWPTAFGTLFLSLGCLCIAYNKHQSVALYILGGFLAIIGCGVFPLHYYYKRKLYTIKVTKPANGDIVIVDNTVLKNPQYIFNQAAFVQTAPYIIYLMHDKGDIHVIVDYILEIKDLYAMMDLIGNHLEIGVRKDD